jgi:hypothetical protein
MKYPSPSLAGSPGGSLAGRPPRVRATEYTPAVLRFPSGDCVTGSLQVISSTGGLLSLSKPLIRGTRIKVMFLTHRGPVLGSAEMLSPVSWTEQPFRFVTLAYGDQRRLKAITGDTSRVEASIPEPIRPIAGREQVRTEQVRTEQVRTEQVCTELVRAELPRTELIRAELIRTELVGRETVGTEPDWIDKYRAALSQNPPRRPFLERMLEALIPGTK